MYKNMHIDNPCKRDCAERSPYCHAECKKYLDWVKSREPELKAKEAKRISDSNYCEYVRARGARFGKKYGGK